MVLGINRLGTTNAAYRPARYPSKAGDFFGLYVESREKSELKGNFALHVQRQSLTTDFNTSN
jgi:hypothetical protein